MDIRDVTPFTSTYSSLKEIRKARINKLIDTEIEQSMDISSMSLEDQKNLNGFYNDILSDIYNIRNNHPLKEIAELTEPSKTETIDSDLHNIGKMERAIKETYKDRDGINHTRIIWKDGTELREVERTDRSRTKIVKWQEGVTSCHNDFSGYPEDKICPESVKKFFIKNSDIFDNYSVSETDTRNLEKQSKSIRNFIDLPSFEKTLDDTLSESKIIKEKRIHWEKDCIRQRERLYENNLSETITKWEKTGIKEKKISDTGGDFYFSHIVQNRSIDTIKGQYKDIYVEKSTDYDRGVSLWRYKKGNNYLEHCSIVTENRDRLNYTKITDNKNGNSRISVVSPDMRITGLDEPGNKKKIRLIDFPEKNIEINYTSPDIDRHTLIEKNGSGTDISKVSGKGEFHTSWLPDREVLRYSRTYPGGVINKCYFYNNNITRQLVTHQNGNSYDLLELPNNILKKSTGYKNGVRESITWFDRGEQRRTVRYPDNTLLVDLLYDNGAIQKQGIKFSNGTCYLYKNWGNGISQQCFCWPGAGMAHLSTEFQKDNLFDNKTIYPDGSYMREIISPAGKSSMKFSRDPLLENIYGSAMQEILSSPLLGMKLRENPFHNPFLTIDPQLWAHAILKYGSTGEMSYIPETPENLQKLPYVKMSFRLSIEGG